MYHTIPDVLYGSLPKTLADLCAQFEQPHERDIFLHGALMVCGSAFANCRLLHRDGPMDLNLYMIAIGPPGGGKGVLRYARQLGAVVDSRLCGDPHPFHDNGSQIGSDEGADAYDDDDGNEDGEANEEGSSKLPKKRERPLFFIPGNTSLAALMDMLRENPRGAILETELKGILNAVLSKSGEIMTILLKAYHQEYVSLARKGRGYYRIPRPSIGLAATGTPNDLPLLAKTIGTGFFSRLGIYRFDGLVEWMSHKPSERSERRTELIAAAAAMLDEAHAELTSRGAKQLDLTLSDDNWDYVRDEFEEDHMEAQVGRNDEIVGTVARSAVRAERIAAILTLLRTFEQRRSFNGILRLKVTPQDVRTGVALGKHYLSHSRMILEEMSGASVPKTKLDMRLEGFLTALPNPFTTGEALHVGMSMKPKVMERTVKSWLSQLLKQGRIEKIEHGVYEKVTD
jgi:hypothetical protein